VLRTFENFFSVLFLKVSILTTSTLRTRKSPVKHIEYEVSSNDKVMDSIKKLGSGGKKPGFLSQLWAIKEVMQLLPQFCDGVLENKEAKRQIMEADILVTLSVNICGTYFAYIFDKPFITLHPGPLSVIGSFAGVPLPPSYVPIAGMAVSDQISFMKRVQNFILFALKDVVVDAALNAIFKKFQHDHGKKAESAATLFGRAEAHIVTMDFSFEFAHPLMPNVFVVGPITPAKAAALPSDLEQFMQDSGDDGVVVVSFGGVLSEFDEAVVANMLMAISRIKQKFIWKIKLRNGARKPSNLKAVNWLPQNDLLGHPKTKAFISHMGINGASEAAYHGVPVVAACVITDSFQNSIRFSQKAKMSYFVDVYQADADAWEKAINEVINNSSYKENAVKASKLMRSWPRTSVEKAGDVIQYAVDNGGRLPHWKSYANNLYWFQYHCIDVMLFLFAIGCFAIYVFYRVTKGVLSCVCSRKRREKTD